MIKIKHKIASFLNKIAAYLNRDIPGAISPKVPLNFNKVEISTSCTYEAAYYLLKGAIIDRVEIRKVPENKIDKLGYLKQWKVFLSNVPERSVELWNTGQAFALVPDIESQRRRIKRFIKKHYGK